MLYWTTCWRNSNWGWCKLWLLLPVWRNANWGWCKLWLLLRPVVNTLKHTNTIKIILLNIHYTDYAFLKFIFGDNKQKMFQWLFLKLINLSIWVFNGSNSLDFVTSLIHRWILYFESNLIQLPIEIQYNLNQ